MDESMDDYLEADGLIIASNLRDLIVEEELALLILGEVPDWKVERELG